MWAGMKSIASFKSAQRKRILWYQALKSGRSSIIGQKGMAIRELLHRHPYKSKADEQAKGGDIA